MNPYHDVKQTDWFYGAAQFVSENGLMNGMGPNMFAPTLNASRAMIVTMLWRLDGMPHIGGGKSGTFADVDENTWYTEAAEWAAANGIMNGFSGAKFGPNDDVTREQLATILYNYAKYKGYDVSVGEDTNILSYNDAFSITEYAFPALQWACGSGVMNGDNHGNLNPGAPATRAEIAAMLQRFMEFVIS